MDIPIYERLRRYDRIRNVLEEIKKKELEKQDKKVLLKYLKKIKDSVYK